MLGRVDILVNNAGIYRAGTIDTLTLDDFNDTMAVNLRAAFVASKAAAGMASGGRIISIGSNLAVRAPGQPKWRAWSPSWRLRRRSRSPAPHGRSITAPTREERLTMAGGVK